MQNIGGKAGKRFYMLYHLKRAGITLTDMATVCVVVRPVLEHALKCI